MNQATSHHTTVLAPVLSASADIPGLSTFRFALSDIRVVTVDGEPMFVANDVARALQLSDAAQAVEKLDDDERGRCSIPTPTGLQSMRTVTESGLYALIMRCRGAMTKGTLPHTFRKWVTSEVLPSIRKTNAYAPAVPAFDPTNAAALRTVLLGYTERVIELEAAVEAAAPAVAFVGALADGDGTWGLQAAGKALHQGPNRFVAWLRDRGDIFDRNGGPVANQRLIDRGLFTVVWEEHGGKPRPKTKVTGKGIVFYAKALGVKPPVVPSQALLPGF